MKAYQLVAVNDLRYNEIDIPELQSGWCLVKVMAAGICSSDIPRIFTKGTYHFPTIPGHEYAGIVEKVADSSNEAWVGKRVGVFPLIPCKECTPCKNHQYEMCEHYDYTGSRRDGAFAEYVAVPVWNLIEIPENVKFEEAAMFEPLAVGLHASKIGKVHSGDKVAIIGTGMIGFAVAQWAQSMGATQVDVIGRNETKRAIAERIGVNYKTESDAVIAEYDVVVEAVGTNDSIIRSVQLVKAGGRIVWMGNPAGDIGLPQDVYWRILRKQITVSGTWNSAYESGSACDWSEVVEAVANKKMNVLPLITHTFSQAQLQDGLELMKEHKEPYCKVMTLWNV